MSEREELATLIATNLDAIFGTRDFGPTTQDYKLADALIEAGYRKPWTIATAAERAILQPGTICMDKAGNAWKRGTGSWVSTGGDTGPLYDEDDIELSILHEGTQP